MNEEIIIQRLAIFETKLDNVLTIIPNHDTWIRELQQRKEECVQDVRIQKIESRIENIESMIQAINTILAKFDGGTPYLERAIDIGQSIIVALIVVVALFFMKGGSIT